MRNINDLLNENNFFKNLGVGRYQSTKKWIEDNKDVLSEYYFNVNDDGTITIKNDSYRTDIMVLQRYHVVQLANFKNVKPNLLRIPSFITINGYLNPLVSPCYLYQLEFDDIESSGLSEVTNKSLLVEACKLSESDINYLISNKNLETIQFNTIYDLSGNLKLNCDNKKLQSFDMSKVDITNLSLNLTLGNNSVLRLSNMESLKSIKGTAKGCTKVMLNNIKFITDAKTFITTDDFKKFLKIFKDCKIFYINGSRVEMVDGKWKVTKK